MRETDVGTSERTLSACGDVAAVLVGRDARGEPGEIDRAGVGLRVRRRLGGMSASGLGSEFGLGLWFDLGWIEFGLGLWLGLGLGIVVEVWEGMGRGLVPEVVAEEEGERVVEGGCGHVCGRRGREKEARKEGMPYRTRAGLNMAGRREECRDALSSTVDASEKSREKAGASPFSGPLPSNLPFRLLLLPCTSPQSCPRDSPVPVSAPSPSPLAPMNSYTTEPGTSHGDLLADRLRRLDVPPEQVDHPVQAPDGRHPKPPYDGYGFRPASGMSSPHVPPDRNSPLPDVNGLGWPGELTFHHHPSTPPTHPSTSLRSSPSQAKSTLSRLNASPAEKADRQTRLAAAVRTVLECIGEDPSREGLLRTPERYAQALMWMTKGYEERLAGAPPLSYLPTPPPTLFFFFECAPQTNAERQI